jgi:hypothetical protein
VTDAGLAEDLILHGDGDALVGLAERLRQEGASSVPVLHRLAESTHSVVRAWVATSAARILVTGASSIVAPLMDDPDADVREAATEGMLAADPEAAMALVPRLRRQLGSSDYWEPVTAMWRLARLGDIDALAEIAHVERNATRAWHRRNATVVRLLLSGEADKLLKRLASHDHEWTTPLVHAAMVINTPAAAEALRDCLHIADAECAEACEVGLARVATE